MEEDILDARVCQSDKDDGKSHKAGRALAGLQEYGHDAMFTSEVSVEVVGGHGRRRNRKPSVGNKELALHSLGGASKRTSSKEVIARTNTRADILIKTGCVDSDSEGDHSPTSQPQQPSQCRVKVDFVVGLLQKYSLPLVSGVLLALIWSNVDETSYRELIHWMPVPGFALGGHNIDLHFVVNDIFMCFFFALQSKRSLKLCCRAGPCHRSHVHSILCWRRSVALWAQLYFTFSLPLCSTQQVPWTSPCVCRMTMKAMPRKMATED